MYPQGVELQPVPEEIYTKVPDARRYEYFDWNGRVVFVDPGSRKVVIVDRRRMDDDRAR